MSHSPLTFTQPHRFSLPDWATFLHSLNEKSEAEFNQSLIIACRDWLARIHRELGEHYESRENANFIVIAPRGRAQRVLDYCQRMRSSILKTLAEAASDHSNPIPVLCFESIEVYYDYVHDFVVESDSGGSGGMFIHYGYGHFALPFDNFSQAEPVIVHELAHALIKNQAVPKWLNEGIAQLFEVSLSGLLSWRFEDVQDKIDGYWTPETVSEFIFGNSFSRSDDGQVLSYHLALVLTKKLVGDLPRFRAFMNEASGADGGNSALLNHFKVSLNDLVSDFLGDHDWIISK